MNHTPVFSKHDCVSNEVPFSCFQHAVQCEERMCQQQCLHCIIHEHMFIRSVYISKQYLGRSQLLIIMKGTKVLTLGAGREVLPHNMAVTKMYYRCG